MGALFKFSGFVALVAITVMYKPELVLMLPNGFIPYAILGHPPPIFMKYDAWQKDEFESWTKDGDLVVAAGAKSGTNWLLYMAHLIRVKGDVDTYPFDDVNLVTPWPTLLHQPGQQWPEIKEKMFEGTLPDGSRIRDKWDHSDYPFRIFKSHETPDKEGVKNAVLPIRTSRKIKFLAAFRNPADVLRSLYPFFSNHDASFRRMWGDFPPVYTSKDQLMADFCGGPLTEMVWGYPNAWFEYKDDPNVLIFTFEEMLRDREGHVKKLAAFVNVDLSPAQVAKITHLTSFAEMKRVADRFDYMLWAHRQYPTSKVMQAGKLLRSGKKSEGGKFFTPDEMAVIQSHIQTHFSDDLQRFMGLI